MSSLVTTVVSALIRDPAASEVSNLLLGVRQPVLTSQRHPGVLSTLTMRVPEPMFRAALAEAAGTVDVPASGTWFKFRDPESRPFGTPGGLASVGVFLIEALLARKVEIGSALVQGQVAGLVSPLGVATDVVEDPKGGFGPELTQMLTYEVVLERGRGLIPPSSSSYKHLRWVAGRDLSSALSSNDALLLIPDADPFEVCIHGLCVRSAANFLDLEEA